MGFVPKQRIAIANPTKKAAMPTLSADHRRNTRRYNAKMIGKRTNAVPSKGFAATKSVIGRTMAISLRTLNDSGSLRVHYPYINDTCLLTSFALF
jgi:hypothetical protein